MLFPCHATSKPFTAGSWQGRGRMTAWSTIRTFTKDTALSENGRVVAGERHGMCESVFNTAWKRHGNGTVCVNRSLTQHGNGIVCVNRSLTQHGKVMGTAWYV